MEELKIGPPGAGVITGKRSPFLEKKGSVVRLVCTRFIFLIETENNSLCS